MIQFLSVIFPIWHSFGIKEKILYQKFDHRSVLCDKKRLSREYYRGKYHCTVDLLFDWFGISCMSTDIFFSFLQNRIIKISQTGGQQYSDTSPFSIPWVELQTWSLPSTERLWKPLSLRISVSGSQILSTSSSSTGIQSTPVTFVSR